MSTVCVLTPIVVGSWPAITTAVLGAMGRVEDGLAALNEARVIAANAGLTPMVEELDRLIAALRTALS